MPGARRMYGVARRIACRNPGPGARPGAAAVVTSLAAR
jgi:hypothetical protein